MQKRILLARIFTIIFLCASALLSSDIAYALPVTLSLTDKLAPDYDQETYKNYGLMVSLKEGRIHFNNIDGSAAFKPVSFMLKNQDIKRLEMHTLGDNFFNSKAILTVSYADGVFSLDTEPFLYTKSTSFYAPMTFKFNPQWLSREEYRHVSTQGKANLDETALSLQLIPLYACAPTPRAQINQEIRGSNVTTSGYDQDAYKEYELMVTLQNGSINFNNVDGYAAFDPVFFTLKNHETKRIDIKKLGDNFFHSNTVLTTSYADGVFLLDTEPPSYATSALPGAAATFDFNDAWLDCQAYDDVSTQGKAGLDGASLILRLIPGGG